MEKNITDEQIDYEKLGRIACCSSYQFQRMFSYLAGISISEYIRRRKMSLAAVDLQSGREKVIDVAIKYGYSSPTAFNRAFQNVHGIAPSRIKDDDIILKSYPPICFSIQIRGKEEMEFKIVKRESIRVLGVSTQLDNDITKAYEEGEALWLKIFTKNNGELCNELNEACDAGFDGFFGIETEHNNGGEYTIAVASTKPATGNLKEHIIPAHTWAVFKGKNFFADEYSDAESAIKVEECIYTNWLPTSGYELADNLNVHFLFATNNLEKAPFEMWLPVKKR